MKYYLLATLLISLLFSQSHAKGCSVDSEHLGFNFEQIPIQKVFAVLADFRGLETKIDPSIKGDITVQYECIHWLSLGEDLAEKHNLEFLVINDTLYVSKR